MSSRKRRDSARMRAVDVEEVDVDSMARASEIFTGNRVGLVMCMQMSWPLCYGSFNSLASGERVRRVGSTPATLTDDNIALSHVRVRGFIYSASCGDDQARAAQNATRHSSGEGN